MIYGAVREIVERFPKAAIFIRNVRDLMDRRQDGIATPWGFVLAGHPSMASGDFEPEETHVVRALLKDVDLLVNVGANVGYYCCHALSMGKEVIAVEPNLRNLHYLLRNIGSNGWSPHAEVFPVALGSRPDIVQMWGGGTGASVIKGWASIPETYVTEVPVLTLDRVLGDRLNNRRALIIVDIEGAEFMMLQGAMGALRNNPKPVWMIEITATQHQPKGISVNPHYAEIFELFFSEGYRGYAADASRLQITTGFVEDVTKHHRDPNVHNFVFQGE
jgi:FkbM family methyltransferase